MRAEGVGIDVPAPFGVDAGRAILARPDAVAPVIEIGEAAAGPADQRHLEPPQGGEHVVAQSVRIGDRRLRAHPDAAVDASADILGELAEAEIGRASCMARVWALV